MQGISAIVKIQRVGFAIDLKPPLMDPVRISPDQCTNKGIFFLAVSCQRIISQDDISRNT